MSLPVSPTGLPMSLTMPLPPPLDVVRLAVDCMGGDHGTAITLPACAAFLRKHPAAQLLLVGRPQDLAHTRDWERCSIVEASEVVEMGDSIEMALRHKKQSSMRVALSQVRPASDGAEPLAHACVSAGNTGALMAVARYLLKTIEGIDRPAIASVMPNRLNGFTTVLDLGANVDCLPENLLQFAVMGSALVCAVQGKSQPSVGLLNIGEEAIKGSEIIKRTAQLLRQAGEQGLLNFHGNVEGNDIFKGTVDVVVCDGFVGNVALKSAEGMASLISGLIKQEFARTPFTRLLGLAAMPVLKKFKQRADPRCYNGAALLGLRGLVFKSHGSADAFSFEHALNRAYDAARNHLLIRVRDQIQQTLKALPAPVATPTSSSANIAA
jgi:phosphate acyltransferase